MITDLKFPPHLIAGLDRFVSGDYIVLVKVYVWAMRKVQGSFGVLLLLFPFFSLNCLFGGFKLNIPLGGVRFTYIYMYTYIQSQNCAIERGFRHWREYEQGLTRSTSSIAYSILTLARGCELAAANHGSTSVVRLVYVTSVVRSEGGSLKSLMGGLVPSFIQVEVSVGLRHSFPR